MFLKIRPTTFRRCVRQLGRLGAFGIGTSEMRGINTDLMPSMPNAKVEVAALGEKWAFFGLAKKKYKNHYNY